MYNLICKSLQTTYNIHFLKIHRCSSLSLKSVENTPNQPSFTVNYLINSCGFPPEKAFLASKYMNFETIDKPDSALAFFNHHGFSKTQISKIIWKYPRVLVSNPQKTLFPKLDFFKSKGVSSTDIAKIVTLRPGLLKISLENFIIPSFNLFKNLTQSEERAIFAIKRCPQIFAYDLQECLLPNIEILREAGVPNPNIVVGFTCQPRAFMTNKDVFRQVVKEVEKMGFNPLRMKFVLAVNTMRGMTKPIWEKKVDAFKKWGWSEDEILLAFGRNPRCMRASEDKIMAVMDFLVNKVGWDSSMVAERPGVMTLSLEKRIIPRCAVYQVLLSKGLVKKEDISLQMLLESTEMNFLKRVVKHYEEEAPELLKLYKEKLALAK